MPARKHGIWEKVRNRRQGYARFNNRLVNSYKAIGEAMEALAALKAELGKLEHEGQGAPEDRVDFQRLDLALQQSAGAYQTTAEILRFKPWEGKL
jgi:hypothetical protein